MSGPVWDIIPGVTSERTVECPQCGWREEVADLDAAELAIAEHEDVCHQGEPALLVRIGSLH